MLLQCIASILALNAGDTEKEIIIVDDGSDTDSQDVLPATANEIKYFRQQNQGQSVARNRGLEVASGDYIQFVDADDYLMKPPYEACLNIIRTTNCDMLLFESTSKVTPVVETAVSEWASGSAYMRQNNIKGAPWGYIFRKDMLGDLRFQQGKKYTEDEEFTALLMLKAGKVCHTTAKAYFYRQHDGSLIHRLSGEEIRARLEDHKKTIFHLSELSRLMEAAEKVALQRRVAQLTMDYLYNVMILTRDGHYLEEQTGILSRRNLFPLPNKRYTLKYTLFSVCSRCRAGRNLMILFLSLIK